MPLFIQSNWLSTYYVPHYVLGAEDTTVGETLLEQSFRNPLGCSIFGAHKTLNT